MTRVLDLALAEVAKLPELEQEALGTLLMDEIDSERKWAASLATSQQELAALADEALAEFRSGKTRPLADGL